VFPLFDRFSGPLQSRPLDHNISKRSRSPTLYYQDVDDNEAHRDAGANARRYLILFLYICDICYNLCLTNVLIY
jgi:hypothetical protein